MAFSWFVVPNAKGGHQPRRALIAAATVLGVLAIALGLHGLQRELAAVSSEQRSAPSQQLLEGDLQPDGDVSARLYADLQRHLRWQSSDVRALIFKARLDMEAQRYEEAAAAYKKAVSGASKAAKDPGVWVEYAEALGMAHGRTLDGEPLKLVHKALSLDASHAPALDLAGSAAWEIGNFASAAEYWKQLLRQLPTGTARHTELSQAIERAERRARISLPAAQQSLAPQEKAN
jgi:cytochrome c-type biogenesis protein CcmH/NrfG